MARLEELSGMTPLPGTESNTAPAQATGPSLGDKLLNVVAPKGGSAIPLFGMLGGIRNSFEAPEEAANKQALMQTISQKLQSGDVTGAIGASLALDTKMGFDLIKQLGTLDPKYKNWLAIADEGGELQAQTAFGSNPAQLKAMDMANQTQKEKGRLTEKQDLFAQQMFKTVTGHESFKNLQELRQRQGQLEEYALNPSAFGDVGALTSFSKSIDPGSVVRPSEYATAEEARSLVDRVRGSISKAEKGQTLTPEQRQDLVRLAKHMNVVYTKNYQDYMKPVYKQAKARGIDIDLVDPYAGEALISGKSSAPAKAPAAAGKTVDVNQFPAGSIIQNKQGQQFTVNPDGTLSEN